MVFFWEIVKQKKGRQWSRGVCTRGKVALKDAVPQRFLVLVYVSVLVTIVSAG